MGLTILLGKQLPPPTPQPPNIGYSPKCHSNNNISPTKFFEGPWELPAFGLGLCIVQNVVLFYVFVFFFFFGGGGVRLEGAEWLQGL